MSADVPYSATDLAKAFRIFVRTSEDIQKRVSPLYRRWRNRDVARNLDALSFRAGGMREPLQRLAIGTGTPDDKVLLAAMLKDSAERVRQAIGHLEETRGRLRERFGMDRAMELDEIISDKIQIRDCLGQIAHDPELLMESPAEAVKTLKQIQKLNRQAAKLHDILLSPPYVAKPSSSGRPPE